MIRKATALFLFFAILLLSSCGAEKPKQTDLFSDKILAGTGPVDGIYMPSSLVYQKPGASLSLSRYEYYGILDNVLYGFDFRSGDWDQVGPLTSRSLSAEEIAGRIDKSAIDHDRVDDPRAMLLKADYAVETNTGITYYLHPYSGTFVDGVFAEENNGEIYAVCTMGKMDQFPQTFSRYLQDEDSPVPTKLTLYRETRVFTLSIPAINLHEEGAFRYTDDGMILFRTKTGSALMTLRESNSPNSYGTCYEYVDGTIPGDYLQSGMIFVTPTTRTGLMDIWGSEELDLNGDGRPEIVYFGDYGLSGPSTLTVSVDSEGTDACVWYYAKFRSLEIVKENGHLYVDTYYVPFQKPPVNSRYEVRYDGVNVWIEDSEGNPVDENSGINY